MPKLVAFLFFVLVFAMPCQGGPETVVSSVGCTPGGMAYWSNPAIWTPMQVPDNGRPPGTTYDVFVQCFIIDLDMSFTVNQLSMRFAYWNGQKPPQTNARGVSITVLRDARITGLTLANGKLTVGGTTLIDYLDGWTIKESKLKTGNYIQDSNTWASFSRSTIDVSGTARINGLAGAQLSETALETQQLELLGGNLSLQNGSTVKVKGDYIQSGAPASLRFHLNGSASFTVEGNAQLGGGISGLFTDGYVPTIGEEFPLLRCKGSITGSWTTAWLPPLPAGRTWSFVVADRTVSLKVVAAP